MLPNSPWEGTASTGYGKTLVLGGAHFQCACENYFLGCPVESGRHSSAPEERHSVADASPGLEVEQSHAPKGRPTKDAALAAGPFGA
jgi:hypothetical protein